MSPTHLNHRQLVLESRRMMTGRPLCLETVLIIILMIMMMTLVVDAEAEDENPLSISLSFHQMMETILENLTIISLELFNIGREAIVTVLRVIRSPPVVIITMFIRIIWSLLAYRFPFSLVMVTEVFFEFAIIHTILPNLAEDVQRIAIEIEE